MEKNKLTEEEEEEEEEFMRCETLVNSCPIDADLYGFIHVP